MIIDPGEKYNKSESILGAVINKSVQLLCPRCTTLMIPTKCCSGDSVKTKCINPNCKSVFKISVIHKDGKHLLNIKSPLN